MHFFHAYSSAEGEELRGSVAKRIGTPKAKKRHATNMTQQPTTTKRLYEVCKKRKTPPKNIPVLQYPSGRKCKDRFVLVLVPQRSLQFRPKSNRLPATRFTRLPYMTGYTTPPVIIFWVLEFYHPGWNTVGVWYTPCPR